MVKYNETFSCPELNVSKGCRSTNVFLLWGAGRRTQSPCDAQRDTDDEWGWWLQTGHSNLWDLQPAIQYISGM